MILLSRLIMLVTVIVLLVFCMSNLDPIIVKFVGWESPQMPLFLILLFVFFFGFFLALFWQALRSVTMKKNFKPAPIIPRESKPAKEKTARRWGRKKDKKTDVDQVVAEEGSAKDNAADANDVESTVEKDENTDEKTEN